MEQTLEWNTGLYMVFADFEQGFDLINQDMLWKILRHYGIPKIVRLIEVLHKGFQARVLHAGDVMEPFNMKIRVHH